MKDLTPAQPIRNNERIFLIQRIKNIIYFLGLIVAGNNLCSGQIVVNGSFETGPTPPNGGTFVPAPDSTTIPGWTVQSGSVDYVGSDTWQAADGVRSLDMSGHDAGSILQNVSGFTIGQQYQLSFYMAANEVGPPTIKHLTASIDSATQTFTFDSTGHSYANMGWSLRTLDFTADNSTMALSFTSLDDTFYGPTLDNVSISAVPEPCTVSILCTAAGILVLWRTRKSGC